MLSPWHRRSQMKQQKSYPECKRLRTHTHRQYVVASRVFLLDKFHNPTLGTTARKSNPEGQQFIFMIIQQGMRCPLLLKNYMHFFRLINWDVSPRYNRYQIWRWRSPFRNEKENSKIQQVCIVGMFVRIWSPNTWHSRLLQNLKMSRACCSRGAHLIICRRIGQLIRNQV